MVDLAAGEAEGDGIGADELVGDRERHRRRGQRHLDRRRRRTTSSTAAPATTRRNIDGGAGFDTLDLSGGDGADLGRRRPRHWSRAPASAPTASAISRSCSSARAMTCVTGGNGNEAFDGGAGNDTLKGGAGDDTLCGWRRRRPARRRLGQRCASMAATASTRSRPAPATTSIDAGEGNDVDRRGLRQRHHPGRRRQ